MACEEGKRIMIAELECIYDLFYFYLAHVAAALPGTIPFSAAGLIIEMIYRINPTLHTINTLIAR